MARDRIYKADNARFIVDGMNLEKIIHNDRDAEMRKLLDLLDEFYEHGVEPKCEEGMTSHIYAFGTWHSFIYGPFEDVRNWHISTQTYARMSTSLMAKPGIFRDINIEDWEKCKGFRNDCGFSTIDSGLHYSGDKSTWHKNREIYFQRKQEEIDWDYRDNPDLSFLPNRHRSDILLQRKIDEFVDNLVKEEARKNRWTIEEYNMKSSTLRKAIEDKLDKNVGVTFHDKIMNDKDGSRKALADVIGTEICETNFYIYEDKLTKDERIASGSYRKIFRIISKSGKKQYISIDFAHGMFEFYNHKGEHLGEFRFNGMLNSQADSTHNLRTL